MRVMKLFKKVQNSKGQIADIIMFIFFISFVAYFIFAYTSMQVFFKTQNFVDEIVRTQVEQIRTKGIFTKDDFKDMRRKIDRYGAFYVYVSLDAQDVNGNYKGYITNGTDSYVNMVLDKPLKVGDMIKITADGVNRPLFAEMLSRNFMFGFNRNSHTSFKMQSMASGMICTDGFIRGLEVINIISRYRTAKDIKVITINEDGTEKNTTTYDSSTSYDANTPSDETWIKPDGRFQVDTMKTPMEIKELLGN